MHSFDYQCALNSGHFAMVEVSFEDTKETFIKEECFYTRPLMELNVFAKAYCFGVRWVITAVMISTYFTIIHFIKQITSSSFMIDSIGLWSFAKGKVGEYLLHELSLNGKTQSCLKIRNDIASTRMLVQRREYH